jgi:hypothetical protein
MIINEASKRVLQAMWLLLVLIVLQDAHMLVVLFVVSFGDYLVDRSVTQWNAQQSKHDEKRTTLPLQN